MKIFIAELKAVMLTFYIRTDMVVLETAPLIQKSQSLESGSQEYQLWFINSKLLFMYAKLWFIYANMVYVCQTMVYLWGGGLYSFSLEEK